MTVIGLARARWSMARALPDVRELAELGPVLCVWRSDLGGELDGWACARSAQAGAMIHAEGVLEWIVFHGPLARACWRLYRLPDSDPDAWERMARRLANDADGLHTPQLRCPLWRKLYGHVAGERWCRSVLDFHAGWVDGQRRLGATLRIASTQALPAVVHALRHARLSATRIDARHPLQG